MSRSGRIYQIDVIPGDGIGQEVVPAAMQCVDRLAEVYGYQVTWRHREWGSDYFRSRGRMMPTDGIEQLADGDAILLGAVGAPDIPDHETLWGLLLPIRREFMQYINLRPIRILPGTVSPLRDVTSLDMVVVRENVEGEYSSIGGRAYQSRAEEFAVQESIFTRAGVSRVVRFAAELAQARKRHLISATKSNGLKHSMPFWDEIASSVVGEFPDVTLESVLVDALAARLVLRPASIDVIVGSNLFADILSDLAAAVAGSIGVAPSANLNPPRRYPSMFEPVHGSAPDIAGKGIANPVGQMWSAALMLDHLGEKQSADALVEAFEQTMKSGTLTRDLGGSSSTNQFTTEVLSHISTRPSVAAGT